MACRQHEAVAVGPFGLGRIELDIPIGMPGWPLFAACTASMESARMALASDFSDTVI
jgi:hypothetical protein